MIAECDECWCGAWRRENISEHLSAAGVDDFEVTDLSTLAFDDKVPSEGDMLGALPIVSWLYLEWKMNASAQ